ncbi:MAG: aminotransferase class V-fold PLP-dependent enzyme [Acholeplasmatales bacterium]|nr:aminotransferase class V-fold PLP-dependent enzyme [Acholeplasmatales bacterium]
MISFLNDYNALACKEVMEDLTKYSLEYNVGYAQDIHTISAINLIRKELKRDSDIYFLAGGTQTNRIGLYQMLKPYEAVICVETGHINVHETGAVESTGHKVLTTKGKDGKLVLSEVDEVLALHNNSHLVLPRAIYITDSTEIGTIYTLKELKEISDYAHKHNLYLYLDGARLGVALNAKENDIALSDLAKYTDMFYIGGTKNGAPLGEALIINNEELKNGFSYLIKNQGGLFAKGYLCGIIFESLFTNDLYNKNAKNSLDKANKLRNVFKKHNIKEAYENPTNQIFVYLTDSQAEYISKYALFELWEKKEISIYRFVTNFNSKDSDIEDFDNILSKL